MKNTETNGAGRGILNAMPTMVATVCLFLGAHTPVAWAEIFPYENMELQVIDQDIIVMHILRETKGLYCSCVCSETRFRFKHFLH